ncbi:hypothetical protein AXX17_AT1G46730 [Arabidopsis thaliana]|uniref:Alpha/beta-Hydrolases superfamily protein n=1 Tax=Arabidopsis thaliana TaxID=3702 RepID=A0A178WM87_ARATH|nr:hypothetical protein AXX17_AT1G46730 [Arabidopsis thaliana]
MAASGSRNNRADEPGFVVQPKGEHRVIIVWLHDKDERSSDSLQFVEQLNLKNVKWICPSLVFPDSFIKGVGGLGMGAAVALHFATSCALNHYTINPRVVVGISGWLSNSGSLKRSIESASHGAPARAASQSIFITHGICDSVPHPCDCGEEAVLSLREAGFRDVKFTPFARFGPTTHENNRNVMVKSWLEEKLQLDVTIP